MADEREKKSGSELEFCKEFEVVEALPAEEELAKLVFEVGLEAMLYLFQLLRRDESVIKDQNEEGKKSCRKIETATSITRFFRRIRMPEGPKVDDNK